MGRQLLPRIAVALVAIEHAYILVLEMFFWNKPLGEESADGLPGVAQRSLREGMQGAVCSQ